MIARLALAALVVAASVAAAVAAAGERVASGAMVLIPSGSYMPFLKETKRAPSDTSAPGRAVAVAAFWIDRRPVTNGEFLAFVEGHPAWRRSNVKPIFADGRYLASWRSDLELARPSDTDRPVTEVSWFAAAAYCESVGANLPTVDQWEYALDDQGRDRQGVRDRSLAWYERPGTTAAPVDLAAVNGYGVAGLVGSIWEWTLDFNSVLSGEEARDPGGRNSPLFCGGGSVGALDPTDYAAYMRFAVRASLKANYTTGTLGFRCAAGAGA